MSRPTLTTEIAFTSTPLAIAPTWYDISAYVIDLTFGYGRKYELDRFEAGTLQLTLDNIDRRFDPTNTASPYYPNVLPVKRVRVKATWSGTTYQIFTGYIQEWPPDWQNPYNDEMRVRATDAFLYLANTTYTGTLPAEFSGSAVATFLTAIGWPTADRVISSGSTFIDATASTTLNGLSHLQDIAAAENGVLYINGAGAVVFNSRQTRLTASASKTSQATFGYGAGELPYSEIVPVYDDALIYNDVHITPLGGAEQIASDATSQAAYFKRSLVKTGVLIGDGSAFGGATPAEEAAGAAAWLVYNFKDPILRFAALVLEPDANDTAYDAIWPHALGRAIGDRITVKWTPPTGSVISKECYIEAIHHEITDRTWKITWQLSPASQTEWWLLDTSALDTGTRLAY